MTWTVPVSESGSLPRRSNRKTSAPASPAHTPRVTSAGTCEAPGLHRASHIKMRVKAVATPRRCRPGTVGDPRPPRSSICEIGTPHRAALLAAFDKSSAPGSDGSYTVKAPSLQRAAGVRTDDLPPRLPRRFRRGPDPFRHGIPGHDWAARLTPHRTPVHIARAEGATLHSIRAGALHDRGPDATGSPWRTATTHPRGTPARTSNGGDRDAEGPARHPGLWHAPPSAQDAPR